MMAVAQHKSMALHGGFECLMAQTVGRCLILAQIYLRICLFPRVFCNTYEQGWIFRS